MTDASRRTLISSLFHDISRDWSTFNPDKKVNISLTSYYDTLFDSIREKLKNKVIMTDHEALIYLENPNAEIVEHIFLNQNSLKPYALDKNQINYIQDWAIKNPAQSDAILHSPLYKLLPESKTTKEDKKLVRHAIIGTVLMCIAAVLSVIFIPNLIASALSFAFLVTMTIFGIPASGAMLESTHTPIADAGRKYAKQQKNSIDHNKVMNPINQNTLLNQFRVSATPELETPNASAQSAPDEAKLTLLTSPLLSISEKTSEDDEKKSNEDNSPRFSKKTS